MIWPVDFEPQIYGSRIKSYQELATQDSGKIRAYFASHLQEARDLLQDSYDKRHTPSTFIEEFEGGYRVGWFDGSYQSSRQFSHLEDAVTDYLLFTYGISRFDRS